MAGCWASSADSVNGFYVSTYFPSRQLPPERVSPFVLMDYGPAREFAPLAHGKRGSSSADDVPTDGAAAPGRAAHAAFPPDEQGRVARGARLSRVVQTRRGTCAE